MPRAARSGGAGASSGVGRHLGHLHRVRAYPAPDPPVNRASTSVRRSTGAVWLLASCRTARRAVARLFLSLADASLALAERRRSRRRRGDHRDSSVTACSTQSSRSRSTRSSSSVLVAVLAWGFSTIAFHRIDLLSAELRARNADLERREASARALHRVSVAIAALDDLDEILVAIVDQARELLDVDVALLLTYRPTARPTSPPRAVRTTASTAAGASRAPMSPGSFAPISRSPGSRPRSSAPGRRSGS